MRPGSRPCRPASLRGFSLVELLVGVTIALIGIVIMFQVLENAENRKRTTASGSDAQIAGSIAMYSLERDLRQAGNGFGSSASLGCTVNAYDTVRGGAFTYALLPVQIVDGANGAPDQVAVIYGSSSSASIGYSFSASTATTKDMASSSSRGGLLLGDLILVTNGTTCGMVEITNNSTGASRIGHAAGAYTDAQNAAAVARFNDPGGFTTGSGAIYNLGPRDLPRRNVWQIVNLRNLVVADDLHNAANMEIGNGIIDLQAEYGIDTDGDFQVNNWQTAAPGNWQQAIAVRVALLARSSQYERLNVTTTVPSWAGGAFTMTNVDGSDDNAPDNTNDWRHYRYRVYQTTIPLRNVIWGTSP